MNAPRHPENVNDAVILAHLNNLAARFDDLKEIVEKAQKNSVQRGEWEQRNAHVDGRFRDQGKEITEVKSEITSIETKIESARTPASVIIATTISVIALGWTILGPTLQGTTQ